MLRRLFGPKNSLIVAFDQWDEIAQGDLSEQLDHLATYYRFSKLSELVTDLKRGTPSGLVALVFSSARKGLFLKVLPELRSRDIPVTVFVDPEVTATNRLTPSEEINSYLGQFPEITRDQGLLEEIALWNDKGRGDWEKLQKALRKYGPFPVERTNPLNYSVTWGKVSEIPNRLREVGLNLSRPTSLSTLQRHQEFLQKRIGEKVQFLSGSHFLETEVDLEKNNFIGVLKNKIGVVEKNISPFDLPLFSLEKTR